jgi:hypothetical protein
LLRKGSLLKIVFRGDGVLGLFFLSTLHVSHYNVCPNQNRAVFYDDLNGPGLDTDSQDSDDTVGSSDEEGEPEAGRGEAALESSLLGVTAGGAGGEEAAAARLRRRAPSLSDDEGLLGEDEEEGEAKVHGHLELDTTAGDRRPRDTASGTAQQRSQNPARDAAQAPAAASRSPGSSETGSMASGRAGHSLTQRSLRTFTLMSDSSLATPVRQPVRLHVVCPELRVLGLADNLLANISGLERLNKLETLDLRSNRIADVGSLGALVNLPGLRVLMLEVSGGARRAWTSLVSLSCYYSYESPGPAFVSLLPGFRLLFTYLVSTPTKGQPDLRAAQLPQGNLGDLPTCAGRH